MMAQNIDTIRDSCPALTRIRWAVDEMEGTTWRHLADWHNSWPRSLEIIILVHDNSVSVTSKNEARCPRPPNVPASASGGSGGERCAQTTRGQFTLPFLCSSCFRVDSPERLAG